MALMTRRGPRCVGDGRALLVQVWAGLLAGKNSAEAPPAPAIPGSRPATPGGSVQVEKGRPGFVIAAPHGTSDIATDVMGRALAKLTGFGLVGATGYGNLDGDGRPFNVNRPRESAPCASTSLGPRGASRAPPGVARGRPRPRARSTRPIAAT